MPLEKSDSESDKLGYVKWNPETDKVVGSDNAEKIPIENVIDVAIDKTFNMDTLYGIRKFVHNVCHPIDIEKFEKGFDLVTSVEKCISKLSVGSFIGLAGTVFGLFKKKNQTMTKIFSVIMKSLNQLSGQIERNFNQIRNQLSHMQRINIMTFVKTSQIRDTQLIDHDLILNIYNSINHGELNEKLQLIYTKINSIQDCTDKIRYTQFVETCLNDLVKINSVSSENYNLDYFNQAMEAIDVALTRASLYEDITIESPISLFKFMEESSLLVLPSLLTYITISAITHVSLMSPLIESDFKISWSNVNTLKMISEEWDNLENFKQKLDPILKVKILKVWNDEFTNLDTIKKELKQELKVSLMTVHAERLKKRVLAENVDNLQEFINCDYPNIDFQYYCDTHGWFYSSRMNDCHGRKDKAKYTDNYGYNGTDGGFKADMEKSLAIVKQDIYRNQETYISSVFSLADVDADSNDRSPCKGFYIPVIYPMEGSERTLILPMPIDIMLNPSLSHLGKIQFYGYKSSADKKMTAKYEILEDKKHMLIHIYYGDDEITEISIEIDASVELTLWMSFFGGVFSKKECHQVTLSCVPASKDNTWYNFITLPTMTQLDPSRVLTSFSRKNSEELDIERFTRNLDESIKSNSRWITSSDNLTKIDRLIDSYEYYANDDIFKIKSIFDEFRELYSRRAADQPKNSLFEIRSALMGLYKMIQNPDISKEEMVELSTKIMTQGYLSIKSADSVESVRPADLVNDLPVLDETEDFSTLDESANSEEIIETIIGSRKIDIINDHFMVDDSINSKN